MTPITTLLEAAQSGDAIAAAELFPIVYQELKQLAAAKLVHEKSHSLNTTALVHEAYLRLIGDQQFSGRGHFFAAAAEAMRRILVDQARARNAAKRAGSRQRVPLPESAAENSSDDDLLAIHEALDQLALEYPEHAMLVKLRFFAGFSADEAALALDISPSTADRRWNFARAWLKRAVK